MSNVKENRSELKVAFKSTPPRRHKRKRKASPRYSDYSAEEEEIDAMPKPRRENWQFKERTRVKKTLKGLNPEENYVTHVDDVGPLAEKIRKVAPNRSVSDVSSYLTRNLRQVHSKRQANDQPIDKWFELAEAVTPPSNDLEKQLSVAVMVATQEPVPDVPFSTSLPSQKENVQSVASDIESLPDIEPNLPNPNYNNIYSYLASAINGNPLPEMSPIESLVIEDCIQSLAEQIKSLNDGDLRLNLRRAYLCLNRSKDQHPEEDEDEILKQLGLANSLNPRGINPNLIMPVPPK